MNVKLKQPVYFLDKFAANLKFVLAKNRIGFFYYHSYVLTITNEPDFCLWPRVAVLLTKNSNLCYLILIIARASADASADESTDKFLKNLCFSLFFVTFLNSQPNQSLFKARSLLLLGGIVPPKNIYQSKTVFKQFLDSFYSF